MMAAEEDVFKMQISVADSFSFTLTEIESMSLGKLNKWYGGVVMLNEHEKGLNGKV